MEDIFDTIYNITGLTRYSSSEVVTPQNIVEDMVNLIPADIFNPDSKFLDPAVKSGRFLAEIYRRLMNSESMKQRFPDSNDRSEHILSNQLYGFATSIMAATISRKQLYNDPITNGNIYYTGSKITPSIIQGVFNRMKFNVVIGNPPYNRGMDIDFVNLGYEMCIDYCVMITPAKWQTAEANQKIASKMSYGEFRKKIVPHMSKVVFYPCCKDIFDILQVDGLTYFIIDKNTHTEITVENKCKYINEFNSVVNRSILNQESLFNIGNEIVESLGEYKKFKFEPLYNRKFQVWTNNQVPGGGLSTIEETRKTQFVGISYIEEDIGISIEHSTASTISFSSDSKQECESFISWINSKFTRFFVAINISKLTGVINDNTFRFVPAPAVLDADGNRIPGKFDHIYTDEELYNTFNLPQKYRDVIESVIKERK